LFGVDTVESVDPVTLAPTDDRPAHVEPVFTDLSTLKLASVVELSTQVRIAEPLTTANDEGAVGGIEAVMTVNRAAELVAPPDVQGLFINAL
jgi:hypothetical protein